MKNFNFFEKLWEHGRTLRRVGMVLVMCLIAITQTWAYNLERAYLKYSFNGTESSFGVTDNNYYKQDLGTLTGSFDLTGIYIISSTGSGDTWTGGKLLYTIYNATDGESSTSDIQPDTYKGYGYNGNAVSERQDQWEGTINKASNTSNSGIYYFKFYFVSYFGMGNDIYKPNGTYKELQYTILPPAVSSYTVTATGKTSGSGTYADPYIVPYGGTLQLDLSGASQGHTDTHSSIQYSVDNSSWGTETSNTRKVISNITKTTEVQNWVVYAKYHNSDDNLDGTTNSKTIYYKAAAPTAGTVFYKFKTKPSSLGTNSVCAATSTEYPQTTSNSLSALYGGTLKAFGTGSLTQLKFNEDSYNFNGSNNTWLIIDLDCPLAEGDVIRYVNYGKSNSTIDVQKTRGTTASFTLAGSGTRMTQTITVPAAFAGVTTLYLTKKAGNESYLMSFEIIRPYTLTLNAHSGSVSPSSLKVPGSEATSVLPHASYTNYWHKGWFAASSGGDAVANPYTATGSTTLHAQYDACSSKTGSIYKFLVKSTLTAGSPFALTENTTAALTVGDYLNTLYGGTLDAYGRKTYLTNTTSAFTLANTGAYLLVTLDCPLQAGDQIKSIVSSSAVAITTSSTRSTTNTLATGTNTVPIPAAFKGASTIYIWRGSSDGSISHFEIIRPTYTVTAQTSTGTNTYGTVSAGASSLAQGGTTTITAVPAEGYQVASWAVSGTGASISPSGASNSTTTTLTMGSANATVTVTFEEIPSCAATADAGDDKATKTGKGVAMAATAATSGYTGAWSIKASSPSTSTSQLSSTSAYNATFTPTTTGTYTLVWTVTDDSDGSCYATDEADVVVTAPSSDATFSSVTIGGETATISGSAGSYTAKIDRPHKGFSLTQDVTFTTNDANATVKLTNSSGEVVTSVDDHDFSSANLVLYVLAEDGSTSATYTLSITTYNKYLVYLTTSASPSENIYSAISSHATSNNYKLSAWDVNTSSLSAANMASYYDLVILAEAPKSDNTTARAVGSAIGNVPVLSFKGFMFGKTNWPSGSGYNPGTGSSALKVITTKTPCHDIFDGLSLTGDSKDITILSSNPASEKNGVQLISGVSASGWRSLADKEISSTTYSALLEYVGTSGSNKALVIPISDNACGVISSATETIIGNAIDYLLDNSALYTINTTKTISAIHVEESDDSDITDNGDGTYSLESEYPIDEDDNTVTVTLSSSCASYSVDYSDLTEGYGDVTVTVTAESGATGTYTLTVTAPVTCTDAELAYGTKAVAKTYGAAAFTNTLMNSHSVSVTYSSTNTSVATVESDGEVTIVGVGETTIKATLSGDATYCDDEVSYTLTVSKADLSVTATAGTATSVTHNSATLPFTMTGTTGVASVTLNIYLASDDSFVKSVTGVTAATSGSGKVTGLSAETEYYFTVTPIGDANHNNGSESSKSSTFTTEEAPTLTALVADELYQAADMANITFTGSDQYWAGLSTNNLFQTYGNGTSNSAKGKTISSTDVTDDISTKSFTSHAYIEGSDVTSGTADPTYGAIEFITPSTAGLLYVYTVDGSSSNLKLRKKGSSTFTALTGSSKYNAIAVDANSNYYIHGNASKRGLYGIQYVSTYAVTITPTDVTKETGDGTAIKGKAYTATFTAKDGYELPDDATVTIASSPATKGSEYTWSVTDGTATLTIGAAYVTGAISISVSGVALETHTITYNAMGGSVDPASETVATATLPTPTHDDYEFDGWYTTAGTKITGTYHPTADITLYAKWKGECANDGILFSQNFGSATELAYTKNTDFAYNTTSTYSNLVGSGANLFTSLTMDGASSSGFAINSTSGQDKADVTGQFQAYKSNSSDGYWSIVRTGKLANTAPTALKVEMDIWYNAIGSGSYVGVNFAIGNGFSDGLKTSSPQSTSYVHSGFGIANESTPKFCVYNTFDTKIYNTAYPESEWQSIVWIINNTGETLTYDNPTGSGTSTVNDDCFDLWMKTQAGAASTYTRIVAGQAAISGNVDLQNIHIGSNSGSTNEFRLDNVVITDLNASGSCYTVTYDGNGAESGYVNDPEQYPSGTTVYTAYNSSITGFKKTGYEFNGWNTTAAGDGEKVSYFTITENTTLYAQWKYVIDDDNTDFSGYAAAPTQYQDVRVTNGATLTLTKNTAVQDITIETGSTLNVSTNSGSTITLATNSLSLVGGWGTVGNETKYDMPRVYIDPASKITKTVKTINFDIAVDNRNFYPIAVPFPVTVSDIDYADAYLASFSLYGTYGQYIIKTYDGQVRANYGGISSCWKTMNDGEMERGDSGTEPTDVLQPGKGYILRALPANAGGWHDDYAIIRFPMKNVDDEWTNGGEKGSITVAAVTTTKNVVPVTAYLKQGDAEDAGDKTPMANRGWNILGVPYMSCYTTSSSMGTSAVIQGKFNYETNKWESGDIRYVTVPTHDFSEYIQEDIDDNTLLDDDPATVLLPGWCFFVQIGTTGNLTFLAADEAESTTLPYRVKNEDAPMPTLKTGIILSGNRVKDKTNFLISDKYSAAEYEINADLEKMFGENGYTLATYSLFGETRFAYNAMSNADAANIIPIGYRAPEEGEYTFSINPRYAENGAFEQVNLIDYEEGVVTNLLQSSYSFTTERTQLDTRFALNVVPRQETPTGIENGANGANDANGVRKLLINGQLFIILDGMMYDATGKAVK